MRQAQSKPYRLLAIACATCAWLAAGFSPAQVAEQGVWPPASNELWYWVVAKTDLSPAQVDAAFKQAIAEEMAFLDPAFDATVFFAKKINITKGKSRDRKKYPDRPEKADILRIEAEWRNGYLNQNRGFSYCFIALDAIRSLGLHYLPHPQERFAKAPAGRNWHVNILAGSLYNFFFALEDSARAFINCVASVLAERGLALTFSKFGLMWENVTPAQAADMGRAVGASVLVTRVAVAGPADRAGIRPLDVILEVNGVKVINFSHFSQLLDGLTSGTKAALFVLRRLKDPAMYPEQNAWDTMMVEMEAR